MVVTPFHCFQLPLPEDEYRSINIVLVPLNGAFPPIKYSVRVKKTAVLRQVRDELVRVAKGEDDEDEMSGKTLESLCCL